MKSDPKRIQLLRILGQQLEHFIVRGRVDITALYDALKRENLFTKGEFKEIRAVFATNLVETLRS